MEENTRGVTRKELPIYIFYCTRLTINADLIPDPFNNTRIPSSSEKTLISNFTPTAVDYTGVDPLITGSAIGFRLDSLLKLTDTRARNNIMTLMHYLCKVLADKLTEVLDFS
ncbi:hypothetical protein E3N88_41341 [Mikania micrantha]|uniref:FH2 domain-containing protein n=1 Tax=Mikania micrantha TaxID=192012 RepID=A0A5N6LQA0_9ASTR|nr:hypothetical protein E3N88_41341 [Mikania micrantha]